MVTFTDASTAAAYSIKHYEGQQQDYIRNQLRQRSPEQAKQYEVLLDKYRQSNIAPGTQVGKITKGEFETSGQMLEQIYKKQVTRETPTIALKPGETYTGKSGIVYSRAQETQQAQRLADVQAQSQQRAQSDYEKLQGIIALKRDAVAEMKLAAVTPEIREYPSGTRLVMTQEEQDALKKQMEFAAQVHKPIAQLAGEKTEEYLTKAGLKKEYELYYVPPKVKTNYTELIGSDVDYQTKIGARVLELAESKESRSAFGEKVFRNLAWGFDKPISKSKMQVEKDWEVKATTPFFHDPHKIGKAVEFGITTTEYAAPYVVTEAAETFLGIPPVGTLFLMISDLYRGIKGIKEMVVPKESEVIDQITEGKGLVTAESASSLGFEKDSPEYSAYLEEIKTYNQQVKDTAKEYVLNAKSRKVGGGIMVGVGALAGASYAAKSLFTPFKYSPKVSAPPTVKSFPTDVFIKGQKMLPSGEIAPDITAYFKSEISTPQRYQFETNWFKKIVGGAAKKTRKGINYFEKTDLTTQVAKDISGLNKGARVELLQSGLKIIEDISKSKRIQISSKVINPITSVAKVEALSLGEIAAEQGVKFIPKEAYSIQKLYLKGDVFKGRIVPPSNKFGMRGYMPRRVGILQESLVDVPAKSGARALGLDFYKKGTTFAKSVSYTQPAGAMKVYRQPKLKGANLLTGEIIIKKEPGATLRTEPGRFKIGKLATVKYKDLKPSEVIIRPSGIRELKVVAATPSKFRKTIPITIGAEEFAKRVYPYAQVPKGLFGDVEIGRMKVSTPTVITPSPLKTITREYIGRKYIQLSRGVRSGGKYNLQMKPTDYETGVIRIWTEKEKASPLFRAAGARGATTGGFEWMRTEAAQQTITDSITKVTLPVKVPKVSKTTTPSKPRLGLGLPTMVGGTGLINIPYSGTDKYEKMDFAVAPPSGRQGKTIFDKAIQFTPLAYGNVQTGTGKLRTETGFVMPSQEFKFLERQATTPKELEKITEVPRSIERQMERQIQRSMQQQKQIQKQIQRQAPRISVPRAPNFRTTPPIKPKLPNMDKKIPKITEPRIRYYVPFVKRYGKYRKIGKPTPSLTEATKFGIARIRGTLGASLQIREAKTGRAVRIAKLTREFRPGKKGRDMFTIVQRREQRIKTPGEKLEIARSRGALKWFGVF